MRSRIRSLLIGLLAYAALLVLSVWLLSMDRFSDGAVRVVVALLPVPAMAGVLLVSIRQYHDVDELAQRIHLMALSVAFLGTMLITFTWGFLEGVGIAPLGGFVVFGILVALYLVGLLWAQRRYR